MIIIKITIMIMMKIIISIANFLKYFPKHLKLRKLVKEISKQKIGKHVS